MVVIIFLLLIKTKQVKWLLNIGSVVVVLLNYFRHQVLLIYNPIIEKNKLIIGGLFAN